jgi:hypothetical protein
MLLCNLPRISAGGVHDRAAQAKAGRHAGRGCQCCASPGRRRLLRVTALNLQNAKRHDFACTNLYRPCPRQIPGWYKFVGVQNVTLKERRGAPKFMNRIHTSVRFLWRWRRMPVCECLGVAAQTFSYYFRRSAPSTLYHWIFFGEDTTGFQVLFLIEIECRQSGLG